MIRVWVMVSFGLGLWLGLAAM